MYPVKSHEMNSAACDIDHDGDDGEGAHLNAADQSERCDELDKERYYNRFMPPGHNNPRD